MENHRKQYWSWTHKRQHACPQNSHAEDISRMLDWLPQPQTLSIKIPQISTWDIQIFIMFIHFPSIRVGSPGIIPPTHPGTMVAVAPRPTGPGTRRNCGAFGASGRGTILKWAAKVQIIIYDQIWMLHKCSSSICQLSFWPAIIHVLPSIFHPISTCYQHVISSISHPCLSPILHPRRLPHPSGIRKMQK